MKKKSIKYGIIAIVLLGAIITFNLLKGEQVEVPTSIKTLDLSLQDNMFYLDEMNYAKLMEELVLPYLEDYKQVDYMTTQDGGKIYYEQYLVEDAKGHIVILHGFTESSQKYKEAIYYFMKEGYSVSVLDHRGHGRSGRENENENMVHIEDFNIYISDLKAFIDQIVIPSTPDEKLFLYAHSMGGAIGALFLEQYPDYFEAAVFSTPMLQINTGSYPEPVAKVVAASMRMIGKGKNYIFGYGPYNAEAELSNIEDKSARDIYFKELIAHDEAIQIGGGSFTWLNESFKAMDQIKEKADQVVTPILLFQAEYDQLVLPGGQYTFANASSNTQLIFVENAQHGIYLSKNDIVIPYFNTIFEFLDEYREK